MKNILLRGLNPSLRLGSVQHCFLRLVVAVLFLFSPQQHNAKLVQHLKTGTQKKRSITNSTLKITPKLSHRKQKVNILEQTTTQITTTPQETKLWNTGILHRNLGNLLTENTPSPQPNKSNYKQNNTKSCISMHLAEYECQLYTGCTLPPHFYYLMRFTTASTRL